MSKRSGNFNSLVKNNIQLVVGDMELGICRAPMDMIVQLEIIGM